MESPAQRIETAAIPGTLVVYQAGETFSGTRQLPYVHQELAWSVWNFYCKQLYNFVEKERNRLKEERDAERTRYMQNMQLEMEREKERSRLRIEEAKERLKLGPLTTQSDPCSGSGISNSATVHAPNKLAQSYHEYVEKLRPKIQSRRRVFEAFYLMHKRCKEPECVEPPKAGQAGSTWEADSRFIPEPNVLAVESAFVAKVANESWRHGDEELCRQGSNGTEKPSAGDSPQPPCMFVSMAADTEVRSTTRSAGENPCNYIGSEPCAEVHCGLDSTIVDSSFRCERRSPEESICIVQEPVKLSSSEDSIDSRRNNPDCVHSVSIQTNQSSYAQDLMEADAPKKCARKCAKRKRRRKVQKAAKAVRKLKQMRGPKRDTTQRKILLRVVTFARRARPHAPNHPKGRGVRQAIVPAARRSRPPPLHSCVRGAECTGKERIMPR
ncbi:hypothetical protein HPB51_009498 [Rhipicephalus microplus]|uniref:Uncharacterized protein n=1 Tax=Rhipicephalus microplus TaxID=6941 RepID=A0A9J6E0N6_RHIMP|nr:hypothetical protein HPB51_009498 [Rhipicephalus microplus]